MTLDSDNGTLYLRGTLQVPTEELRAVNLDPKLGSFKFQLSIKPETTPDGFLILEFPLDQDFFSIPLFLKTPNMTASLSPSK